MAKRKIILRIIISPFLLAILIITYLFACGRHWILFIKYGGEWLTYKKDDPKRMEAIYEILKGGIGNKFRERE